MGVDPKVSQRRPARHHHRIDDHTANPARIIAHLAECEIGAVGQRVHIPLRYLECNEQVSEVGGVLTGVKGAQVDALRDKAVVTRLGSRNVKCSGIRRIVGQANCMYAGLVDLRTSQSGLRVGDAALVHHDDIARLVQQTQADESRRLVERILARPPGHEDNGVRLRRLSDGRNDGDRQLNRGLACTVSIFGDGQSATAGIELSQHRRMVRRAWPGRKHSLRRRRARGARSSARPASGGQKQQKRTTRQSQVNHPANIPSFENDRRILLDSR